MICVTLRKIPRNWSVDIFIKSVSKRGGTWRTLRLPDRRLATQCHPVCYIWSCLTLWKITWKFYPSVFIRNVSRMGGKKVGTWRILWLPDWGLGGKSNPQCHGNSCLILRKKPWKIHVDLFTKSGSERRGSRGGVLGGCLEFLTGDLEERVILDVRDDLVWP